MELGIEVLGLRFLTSGAHTLGAIGHTYSLWQVAASFLLAFFGAYVGLMAARQITRTKATCQKMFWLVSGATAMGGGVWSMHFVGMMAYRMPIAVGYSETLTFLSVIPAFVASAIALRIFTREDRPRLSHMLSAGALIGIGICLMHLMGIAAIQAGVIVTHDPVGLALGVAVAIVCACGALALKFVLDERGYGQAGQRTDLATAAVLAIAITAMHYMAMSATTFQSCETCAVNESGVDSGVVVVSSNIFILLFIALMLAISRARRTSADAALLSAIYDTSQDGLIVADRAGSITRFSPAAEAIFGYAADEVVGRNLSLLMSQKMGAAHAKHMSNYDPDKGGGVMIQNREVIAIKKGGVKFPVDINVRCIPAGRKVVFAATVRDITDRKQAEKAQLTAMEDIEESLQKQITLNESQRQFVAMASHEFRTPLAIIDSAAQRIVRRRDHLTPEQIEDHAERVRGSVQRMTDLVERMLSSERIDAGDIAIHFDDHDLRDIIQNAADRQHEICRSCKITCYLDGLPKNIRCDERALEQVFNNLMSNAVKYSPDDSNIAVRSLTDGDNVVISIEDHGVGIAEEDLPKMFQRYFRAGTSAGIVGTGIGLHLTKMLVEAHGGVVSVHSAMGEGSVFTVRLPIAGSMEKEIVRKQAA